MRCFPDEKRTAAVIFAILFCAYAYFFQGGQDNENARYGQLEALTTRGVLYIEGTGTGSADTILYHGHIYPNKAPGLTLLAVPVWYVFRHLMQLLPASLPTQLHITCYLVSLFTVGVVSALLAVLIFLRARSLLKDDWAATATALGYGLGTIAFPFATLFFSHQITAFFGFASFFLLSGLAGCSPSESWLSRRRGWGVLAAGFCAGYAVTCDYPAALIAGILGLFALYALRSWKERVIFVSGGVAGVVPLFLYNLAAFGNPLFVAYAAYASGAASAFPEHKQGLLGVTLPSLHVLYLVTFGSQRGLFFLNPWLLLAIPGSVFFFLRDRLLTLVCVCIVAAFFIFNAGYGSSIVFWGGGASVGPRHIIPMLPFLALPAGAVLVSKAGRILGLPIIVVSALFMLMATATEPRVGYEYQNPLVDLFWYQYKQANYSIWWGLIFSGPYFTENSLSFNLGKLAGFPPAAQLLPLFAVVWLLVVHLPPAPGNAVERLLARSCFVLVVLFAFVPAGSAFRDLFAGRNAQGLLGIVCPLAVEPPTTESYTPLECAPPLERRVDSQLLFPSVARNFSQSEIVAEWRGFIYIPEDAFWVLGADADDGFAIYIDGSLFAVDAQRHAVRRTYAGRELKAGFHELAVRYVNAGAEGLFTLLWSRMGDYLHPIPAKFLTLSKERI